MKKPVSLLIGISLTVGICGGSFLISSYSGGGVSSEMKKKVASMQIVLKGVPEGADTLDKTFQLFDTLDYIFFSGQETEEPPLWEQY